MLHCRGGCLCPAIFCCFSSSQERVADFYLSVFVCVYVRRGGQINVVSCFITLRESGRQLNIGSLPAAELDSAPVRLFNTQTQAPMETYAKIYTIYITFQQSNVL